MPPMEEHEVRAAAAGDPAALESVFARSMQPLVGYIRARLGPELAARESALDLAQSVYREVIQDFDALEYRGETAFRNWLFTHAVRKILDRNKFFHRARRDIAREAKRGAGDDEASVLAQCYASLATPSQHALAQDELARLERAIAALPEAQRDAVTMSRLLELDYPEIAELMGRSESSVRGLVARGLSVLARELTERSDDRGD